MDLRISLKERKYLEKLRDYQLLKKDSALWSYDFFFTILRYNFIAA
jgi:hypothetical protein